MNFLGILEARAASGDIYCRDFSRGESLDSVGILHQERKAHLNFQKSPLRFKSEFPLFPNYSLSLPIQEKLYELFSKPKKGAVHALARSRIISGARSARDDQT